MFKLWCERGIRLNRNQGCQSHVKDKIINIKRTVTATDIIDLLIIYS